jgi:redox-sensitive bicupin YhaK (pirin superfamily)
MLPSSPEEVPMIRIHKSAERLATRLDWLESRHAFSFGAHFDPDRMGFHALRVLNEDRVKGGTGFAEHAHRDAEILTLVLDGALEHRDSEGGRSLLRRGDVQRMSAGTGVVHAEWNASRTAPVHFVQVWLLPDRLGAPPRYDEAHARWHDAGGLVLLASRDGRDAALPIDCEADVYAGGLAAGGALRHDIGAGRSVWLQVLRGRVATGPRPDGPVLEPGDAVSLEDETALEISAISDAEILLFDLAD